MHNLKADLRTLEWTDALELGSLIGFVAMMVLFAGIKTGAI
jgi:hypothetical protein